MKIHNRHERLIAAPPERVEELVFAFHSLWPTENGRAPVLQDPGFYRAGSMLWQEVDRPGAVRAFRVVEPVGLQQIEHWFELEPREDGTILRHTVAGQVTGEYEEVWRERIEPVHDRTLEALLDKAESAIRPATSEQ